MAQRRDIPPPILDEMRCDYESGDPKKSKLSWITHTYARKYGWTEFDVSQHAGAEGWKKYSGPEHPGRIILGGDEPFGMDDPEEDPRIQALEESLLDRILDKRTITPDMIPEMLAYGFALSVKGDRKSKAVMEWIALAGKYKKIAAWREDEAPPQSPAERATVDEIKKAVEDIAERAKNASPAAQQFRADLPAILEDLTGRGNAGPRSH